MGRNVSVTVGYLPDPRIDPATPAGTQPAGLTGWTLTDSEEFGGTITIIDGTTLGTLRFRDGGPTWYGWFPDNQIAWDNDPQAGNRSIGTTYQNYLDLSKISLVGGALRLDNTLDHVHDAIDKPFTAGLIMTGYDRLYSSGFFEVRCRMPITRSGDWPAFWLTDAWWGPWTSEIDIMEQFDGSIYKTNTYNGSWDEKSQSVDTANWHVYGCRWAPSQVTFYRDGAQTYQSTKNVTGAMYPILNAGSDAAAGDTRIEFDYVRIWQ